MSSWHDFFTALLYVGLASPVFAALIYAIGAARDGDWSFVLFWVFGVFTLGGLAGTVATEPPRAVSATAKAKP